jgi:formylglycine-generating enzyme required for sulfatase activity
VLQTELAAQIKTNAQIASLTKEIQIERGKQMLRWNCAPTPAQLAGIGSGLTNSYRVHDLHGLIWEWVGDGHPDDCDILTQIKRCRLFPRSFDFSQSPRDRSPLWLGA